MKQIKLDNEQKKAIYSDKSLATLVLAPPGSGKTLVMAKRIEYLISSGAIRNPFKILGLTYTNTAANEMRKRVIQEVPKAKEVVHITNFHSFAYSVLRAYGNVINIPRNFTIISEKESNDRLEKLIRQYNSKYTENEHVLKFEEYNNWKNEQILKCNNLYETAHGTLLERILNEYRENLLKENLLDYDHLLYFAFKVLKDYPNVLNYYRAAFKYILVDEFQDTNTLQFEILSLLIKGDKSLREPGDPPVFILADPNQAIYEFQGSDLKNIEKSKELFGCKEIKLENDHRVASEAIKTLKKSVDFFLYNEKLNNLDIPKDKPCYTIFKSRQKERDYLIEKIKNLEKKGVKLDKIALLAPQYEYFDIIKKKLNAEKISFTLMKDISGPSIIKNKYRKLFKALNEQKGDYTSLNSFIFHICETENYNLDDEVISFLLTLSRKYDKTPFKARTLQEKVQLFINEIFLEISWSELLTGMCKDNVIISSIHGSKGLEFDYVIICGLTRNVLPHTNNCNNCNNTKLNQDQWIQNLKVLNVGISRAKEKLYITSLDLPPHHKTCLLIPFYNYLEIEKK